LISCGAPRAASRLSAASGPRVPRREITEMSKPRPRRTSSVVVERLSHARQPVRFASPVTMRVTLRRRAYSSKASAAGAPSMVTVSAPSDSASRSTLMRRLRSASESFRSCGVSTDTTIHSASSASANRLPMRTSSSACPSGVTAIKKRSRASHGREVGDCPANSSAAASTRSAVLRSAISRRASRFGLRKKLSDALLACAGAYTLPAFNRSSRSSGGKSMSSTSSASSKMRSGSVSC
jgi:hypothetical protein